MRKYFYTAFLIMLFLSNYAVVKAINEQTSETKVNSSAGINLTITVGQYSESVSSKTSSGWTSYTNSFSLSPDIEGEFENSSFCPVNKIFCQLTLTNIQRRNLLLSSQININSSEITSYLEDLARKINRDPIDAKFAIENGKVVTFSEAQNGVSLNIEKSLEILQKTLAKSDLKSQQKIDLSFKSERPTINYGDVNNLGISSLIGQGTSNFKGSPKNRVFNVNVATKRFNGLLIKPGEEFSFVKNLGEVDAEHGYLPELVIKQGVTEPEFGGGICQVSSTAFRAAIYSGLKITMRRNHAYPVSYYNPQGMDATIYIPSPDLRFLNNTPNYILIQTRIVGTELFFDFYGTDDGRKTTVDGPYTTDRQPDGALKAHFTQNVLNKDGKELINDVFNSSYNSPYLYPHPGAARLTAKPANWSKDQWKAYQKDN